MSGDFEVLQPPGWPRPSGYANGIAAGGRLIFVAGQIGWNPETCRFESDDFVAQTAQALRNIVAVLHAAGAEPRHLVRLSSLRPEADDRPEQARHAFLRLRGVETSVQVSRPG